MLAGSLLLLGSFLLGGIPFSLLLGLWFRKVDIRKYGSGNVGATNLARVCGWKFFPVAFLLDAAKGFVPPFFFGSFLAACFSLPLSLAKLLLAAMPFLGHIFSPFLRFRGGKGVAAGCGGLLAVVPREVAAAFLGWLTVLGVTRTVGVASTVAAALLPVSYAALHLPLQGEEGIILAVLTALALLVIWRHRENLRRFFGAPTEQ